MQLSEIFTTSLFVVAHNYALALYSLPGCINGHALASYMPFLAHKHLDKFYSLTRSSAFVADYRQLGRHAEHTHIPIVYVCIV